MLKSFNSKTELLNLIFPMQHLKDDWQTYRQMQETI